MWTNWLFNYTDWLFNIKTLKDVRTANLYYTKALENKLIQTFLTQASFVNDFRVQIKNDIKSVAETILGNNIRRRGNERFGEQRGEEILKKSKAYQQYMERSTRVKKKNGYRELSRFADKLSRGKKRKHLNNEVKETVRSNELTRRVH